MMMIMTRLLVTDAGLRRNLSRNKLTELASDVFDVLTALTSLYVVLRVLPSAKYTSLAVNMSGCFFYLPWTGTSTTTICRNYRPASLTL